ncbi:MAG: inner-rane translocator [Actinomycetia bacterium]|jgi:D-xylose transport system permease protein|nr:inner-rane translocator [Actinomycetes bacterium]MDQ1653972.1 D-xylose transport system permease protein [Cryptosporangiaceae bacterium]MDQ1658727.1 D-xylose transport system permease protein [Cryptosporangiaceae bacterium]
MSAPSGTPASVDEPEASAISADLLDPRLIQARGPRGYIDAGLAKVRGGDLGSIPVILGLVAIIVVFTTLTDQQFTSAFNLVNLASQVAATGVMAMGIVLVLLLGEIDLSVGSVSGVAAALLTVLNVNQGYPAGVAVVLAIVAGLVIGLLHGLIFTKLGVPSFVVTLAGLLIWQGAQLRVLGKTGTVNLQVSGPLARLGQFAYVDGVYAYVIAAALVVLYLGGQLLKAQRRRAAELSVQPMWVTLSLAAVLAVVAFAIVIKLNIDRGIPVLFLFFLGIVMFMDWMLRRTRYGRSIFAVGGNIEAARRSGLRVDAIRISVFMLTSMFAAFGGIMGVMYLGSANQGTGTGETLINAIASAVIGGTSLFGGRSRMYSALIGALVIGSIANGLSLLSLDSWARYVITGAVLLAAVVLDAVTQRGRNRSGR